MIGPPVLSIISRWMRSLGGKFILLALGVMSITMGIIGVLNYQAQSNYGLQLLKTKGESLGHFMAAVSAAPILAYDYVTLSDYVRDVSQEKDVVYIVITSPEGTHLASFINKKSNFSRKVSGKFRANALSGAIADIEKSPRVLNTKMDIVFNKKVIGRVLVGMDRKQAEVAAKLALIRQLINNFILLSILAASIYFVFQFSTLRPLQKLMQGARRIAHGNLDENVVIESNDEMGKLAHIFNLMMHSLKLSINDKDVALVEIKELNHTLENRVIERTRTLETLNQELRHLALHDPLTGLPNRVLIQDRLEHSVLDAKRRNDTFAVFMIDLDRFKEVNDTLGHNVGDQLLLQVSQRLLDVLRDIDTVGRLGGDEFAIIVNDVNVDASVIVASKISQAFDLPFTLEHLNLNTSASIGIAIFPEHGESPQDLLKSADVAMYYAKQHKEEFCIYHQSKDIHSEQRLSLSSELREAINTEQLKLYYQPKIDLQRQRMIGVEALVRWQHPEKGIINPDDFIPLAEQTGLIKPLTYWVLERALADLQRWRSNGIELSVAVNLSTQNLQDSQLLNHLESLIKQYKTPSNQLVLEVTETALMQNMDTSIETLRKLKDLGVFLSIDDFGVGYSSFSYLQRLPIDDIKIDKSFVIDMENDIDGAVIVESIISLAHHLGLQVVAEGVENSTAMQQLLRWGCDMAQGYHICRPLPEHELMQFIHQLGTQLNFPIMMASTVAGQAG